MLGSKGYDNLTAKAFETEPVFPPVHTSARTGANPIFDIASKFGLDLETAYCYAERCKRIILAGTDNLEFTFWEELAFATITAKAEFMNAMSPIFNAVRGHLVLQKAIPI
jgi:hypothetical protein